MKILITGAGGFIGSHLVERILERGYEVKAFVRYNSRSQWGWLETIEGKNDIEVLAGDIRDSDSVRKAVKDCGSVFHLAALIGIPYSYQSPLAYLKTNVEGTYNILEAAKEFSLENIIVTSTSETYGTAQYVPIDEKHPLVGQSPYSASKIAADQLAISYHRSFGLPVKIARPFNTYGPRQSARAIIPTIASQILDGHEEIRLGNISPTRDLTYVKDTVDGFLEIMKAGGLMGEATNIGMNEEISIGELARLIGGIIGKPIRITHEEERIRPDASEVRRLRCDNRKIKEETKWRPGYDLKKGLTETIEWIRRNQAIYKAEVYNV